MDTFQSLPRPLQKAFLMFLKTVRTNVVLWGRRGTLLGRSALETIDHHARSQLMKDISCSLKLKLCMFIALHLQLVICLYKIESRYLDIYQLGK